MLRLASGAFAGLTVLPNMAFADEPAMQKAISDMFGAREIKDGRVMLSLPALSENGFSVSVEAEAESPMKDDDYVKRIALFSERNPIPLVAVYNFTPHSGLARISGKIRLGGTQHVHAIAEMSDSSLWGTSAKTFVTLAACVVL